MVVYSETVSLLGISIIALYAIAIFYFYLTKTITGGKQFNYILASLTVLAVSEVMETIEIVAGFDIEIIIANCSMGLFTGTILLFLGIKKMEKIFQEIE